MNNTDRPATPTSPANTAFEDIFDEDQSLLNSFFDAARTDVPDDGFTERVMAALPERRAAFVTLSNLSQHINIVAAVAVFVITAILLGNYISTLSAPDISFNLSALFVNSVLFTHRLFDNFPKLSSQQVVGLAAATIFLMTLFIQRCSTLIQKHAG